MIAQARRLIVTGVAASTLLVAGCGSASSTTTSIATASPSTVVTTSIATASAPSVVTTTPATTTTATGALPSGLGSFNGLSCPSINACIAVGGGSTGQTVESRSGQGAAVFSTDGGSSWSKGTLPSGLGPLNGVSCPSTNDCVAVGGLGANVAPATSSGPRGGGIALVTRGGGSTWSSGKVPTGSGPMAAVSCPTTSQCVAVGPGSVVPTGPASGPASGGSALFTTNGGASWSKLTVPGGAGAFYAVSCPSTSHCVTITAGPNGSDVGLLSADGGSSWSSGTLLGEFEPDHDADDKASGRFSVTLPSGLRGVLGMACVSTSNCVAVGDFQGAGGLPVGGTVFSTGGGSKWSSGTVPSGVGLIAAVSCSTTSRCAAVPWPRGAGGTALFSSDGGSTWSPSTLPSGLRSLYGVVSCPSASYCVTIAAGSNGADLALLSVDGGASWP